MILKYDLDIDIPAIKNNLMKIINQIYKLLPLREEGGEWDKPLQTIIEELAGMNNLFLGENQNIFFPLVCKLEGLFTLTKEEDFFLYRRTVFECLSMINKLEKKILCQ